MRSDTRYFYRTEGRRRVVVAYRHNKETGDTEYGASIFRQDSSKESFVKKEHRNTAHQRLEVGPVRINIRGENWIEIEEQIRAAMPRYGCRGPRVICVSENS